MAVRRVEESSTRTEGIFSKKHVYAVFPYKDGTHYAPIRVKAANEKDAIAQAQKQNRKYKDYEWKPELIESPDTDGDIDVLEPDYKSTDRSADDITDDESITELFGSKKKENSYKELISEIFEGKAVSSIASSVASNAESILSDTSDTFGDDSASKNLAKNTIVMIKNSINSVKSKSPYALVKAIVSIGQKYNVDTTSMDEIKDFIHKVQELQTSGKSGYKAMEFLMKNVNSAIEKRLARTIDFLKREFGIVESTNIQEAAEIDDSIKDAHDALIAAGFTRDRVNVFGNTVGPTDISYSADAEDMLIQVIYDKEWFDGKPGYILQMMAEDEEDCVIINTRPLSLGNCIKIARKAVGFFSDYPSTPKFMKQFAEEYGLQFGL